MKISHALSLLLAKAGATMATNGNDKPMLKSRIPSTGNEWVSLKDGVEFQPAMDHEDPKVSKAVEQARLRFLSQTSEGESSAYETQFIDGSETYYAVLSQAWRYIGFFVDCNGISRDNRMLEEGNGGDACGRYLLWAAVSIYLCSSVSAVGLVCCIAAVVVCTSIDRMLFSPSYPCALLLRAIRTVH
jgi:hypothetical protein